MADDADTDREPFDYKATQDKLILVARFLAELDLARFLEVIERSGAIGPLLDPTAFLRGGQQLGLIKGLAKVARGMQEAFEKFKAEYPELERIRIRGDLLRGMSLPDAVRGRAETDA